MRPKSLPSLFKAPCWRAQALRRSPAILHNYHYARYTSSLNAGQDSNPLNTSKNHSLVEELESRDLAESITGLEGKLSSLVKEQKLVAYSGIDPTASSLHVGHLLPLMNLLHFYLHGHNVICLVGAATASVGDPSGRATERDAIEAKRLRDNFDGLYAQIQRFYNHARPYAISRGYDEEKFGAFKIMSNGDWLGKLGMVEFLSQIGKHVRVGQMLARESVKARMKSSEGINYAEFTYQLLQSYDFWHLHDKEGCRLQIGGNDQYGNITAGIDLISRLRKSKNQGSPDEYDPAYGLTVPLLTTPSGEKFGKSAGNAVWLDENLTSPFELYQYFLKTPDSLVKKHLRIFTLLSPTAIDEIVEDHGKQPEIRSAQHLLANEVVTLIHGKESAMRSVTQTHVLFPSGHKQPSFTASEIIEAFKKDKTMITIPRAELIGARVTKMLRQIGAVKSRGEADNIIHSGGLSYGLGNQKVESPGAVIEESWLLDGVVLLLRVGKGNVVIIRAE